MAQRELVTFDPLVEVSLLSSQLCLLLPSSFESLLEHKTLTLCSLYPLSLYEHTLGIFRFQWDMLLMDAENEDCWEEHLV